MTKKHFIALADFIRCDPALNKPKIIQALSRFCASQNYQFKAGRFEAYIAGECGPTGGNVAKENK